jgi:hypothetical protein
MGGVCATNCCGACGVFAGADVCDAAVRDARAKTAEVSKAKMRMVGFLKTNSEKLYAANTGIINRALVAEISAKAKALQQKPKGPGSGLSHQSPPKP